MATLVKDPKSGLYRIAFRYLSKQYTRSLGTGDERAAEAARGRIEETLQLIRIGRIVVPVNAEPGTWIVSDGRISGRKGAGRAERATGDHEGPIASTIGAMIATYRSELPAGAKEDNTLAIERIHLAHVARILGDQTSLERVDLSAVQRYVKARLAEKHGRIAQRPIRPYTAHKELKSLRTIWGWCFERKHVAVAPGWQLKQVTFPRDREPEPFRTAAEIRERLRAGACRRPISTPSGTRLYLAGDETRSCSTRSGGSRGIPRPAIRTAGRTR